MTATDGSGAIDAMRAFNRFYTERLGVLGRGYLDSGYTLTEIRVLYEISSGDGRSATDLTRNLHIDPAYLSRILKKFRSTALIETRPDPDDLRRHLLTATEGGMRLCERFAERSRSQLAEMLAPLAAAERDALTAAFSTIRRLLDRGDSPQEPAVIRSHRPGDIGWIVQSQAEFYTKHCGWNDRFEALAAEIGARFLTEFDAEREACWIAERDGLRLGSVMIVDGGGDVAKLRLLYVDEKARGLGLGRALVETCVAFARSKGYRSITLWTNDVLHAARHIYETSGFRLVSEERHAMFGRTENGQTWTRDL